MKEYKKIIIAGFPGVGKSYAGTANPGVVADLESSDFHWIYDKDGNKHQHPAWPYNYFQAAEMLALETEGLPDYKDLMYVCISTHHEVLKILKDHKIPFVIYAPESKDVALRRYAERGSSEAFIKSLDENWDKYMNDLKEIDMPMIMSDTYLKEALDMDGTYAYMLDKINNVEKYVFGIDPEEEEEENG